MLLIAVVFSSFPFVAPDKELTQLKTRQTIDCLSRVCLKDLSRPKCQTFIREGNKAGMDTGQLIHPEGNEDARQKGRSAM